MVQVLVQASWWEGLVPTHWCLELGLIPLVGRVMSRRVFIGGSWLRMTLGSLSVDGWGCVPTLLVVWPEVSWHWSLQAIGWGSVSVPKWQLSGELMPKSIPWGIHCQCPCLHSEPQLTPTSPGDPPRPAGRSGLGSYGGTALPWVPVHMKTCVPPARVKSLFLPFPWSSCTQALLSFKAECSGGPSSRCQTPSLESLMWSSEFSLLWENLCNIIIFQFVGRPPGRYGIGLYHGDALLPCCCGFFFVFRCRISFLVGLSLFC